MTELEQHLLAALRDSEQHSRQERKALQEMFEAISTENAALQETVMTLSDQVANLSKQLASLTR